MGDDGGGAPSGGHAERIPVLPLAFAGGIYAVPHGWAQVAQLVEHATENRSVGGSIPPLGTFFPKKFERLEAGPLRCIACICLAQRERGLTPCPSAPAPQVGDRLVR